MGFFYSRKPAPSAACSVSGPSISSSSTVLPLRSMLRTSGDSQDSGFGDGLAEMVAVCASQTLPCEPALLAGRMKLQAEELRLQAQFILHGNHAPSGRP
jgi:hypothetical protein